MAYELSFSGKKYYVDIPTAVWDGAKTTLGFNGQMMSDTMMKECCVVARLRQATGVTGATFNATFAAPRSADHDVIITLAGQAITVDIKVLFPPIQLLQGPGTNLPLASSSIDDEIDSAYEKEKRQGNICCFDLSFLPTDMRETKAGAIHNMYPSCLTLEYDMQGTQLHVIWPDKRINVHKGNWYH